MTAHKRHIDHLTPELIKAYHEGKLSIEQELQIEQLMSESELYQDALEGLDELSNTDRLDMHLEDINQRIDDRLSEETRVVFWTSARRMVAAVAVILVVYGSYMFIGLNSSSEVSRDTREMTELRNADSKREEITQNSDSVQKTNDSTILGNLQLRAASSTETIEDTEVAKSLTPRDQPEKNDTWSPQNSDQGDLPAGVNIDDLLGDVSLKSDKDTFSERVEGDSGIRNDIEKILRGKLAGVQITSIPTPLSIQGRIFSSLDSLPLANVLISEKGSANLFNSAADGRFSLLLSQLPSVLSVARTGYKTQEINLSDTSRLSIALEPVSPSLSNPITASPFMASGDAETKAKRSNYHPGSNRSLIVVPKDGPATPANGNRAFDRYLKDSLRYPSQALANKVKGRVVLEFTVLEDGSTDYFKVIRSLGYGCDEEAIRLIKEGPVWQPKIKNGVPVQSVQKKTIRFKPRR